MTPSRAGALRGGRSRPLEQSRPLNLLLRWRWVVLGAIALGLMLVGSAKLRGGSDWQFFTWGGDMLMGHHAGLVHVGATVDGRLPGGMHTYASYPFLQIGPTALLLGAVLQWGPHQGLLLAGAVVAACGMGFLVLVERAFPRRQSVAVRLAWMLGAGAVVVTWTEITHYRHLDDALTLLGVAAGALAVRRGSPVSAGLVLGLAAATKPWGAPLVCFVLAFPAWRARIRAALAALAAVLVVWGPFVVADPQTLIVGKVNLWLSADSVMHAFGVNDGGPGSALRMAQLAGGALIVAVLAWRGAWWAGPLAAFAWRLGLDPATYPYYAAALVAAAYLADRGAGHVVPWLTYACGSSVMLLQRLHGQPGGWARLAVYGTVLVVALLQQRASGSGSETVSEELTSAAPSAPRSRPTLGLPEAA